MVFEIESQVCLVPDTPQINQLLTCIDMRHHV